MKSDLICFDLDNTLIQSDRAHVKAYNYAFEKNGFPKKRFLDIANILGRPHTEVITILTGVKDRALNKKIYADQNLAVVNMFYKEAKLIKNVKTVLNYVKKKYKIGVVSNTTHKNIIYLLKGAKLSRDYFDVIVGNNDVRHSKPSPEEIFKAEKLIHRRATYIVGDSIYDIIAGQKAKIRTIGVLSGRYPRSELKMYKPDYIINDIKDVINIL